MTLPLGRVQNKFGSVDPKATKAFCDAVQPCAAMHMPCSFHAVLGMASLSFQPNGMRKQTGALAEALRPATRDAIDSEQV